MGRVYTNSVRPAVMFGRGATKRVATEASSGSTSYFLASFRKSSSISFTLWGFFSARSSDWDQSLVKSYNSQVQLLSGSALTGPITTQGGRTTLVLAIQPS